MAGASDVPQAGYGASPPGGMGITSQGFGQEGYILDSSDVGPRPKPPPELENFVIGVPYFLPFATPYRDSWEVFRDDPVSIRQLNAMRRQDGQARGLYRLMTMPILAALKEAKIIPIEDEDGGEEEAKFCHQMMFLPPSAGGMTHPITRFVKQMMLALFNGFTAWELVYWCPKAGPLKNKWTIRKIDWRPSDTLTFLLDGQGEFNGFRQRCLTYDTKVSQLDGTEVPIGEMVERHDAGQVQWVYSCTENGKIVPGRVKHARKVSDREHLVRVTLDNGEQVRCTLTHPWMLRDGTYKRAANLKPGDSLMPLYRQHRTIAPGSQEYEQVWQPGRERWEFTHRVVSQAMGFAAGRGSVIHHGFDGLGHRNNDPRNLHRMTKADHHALHLLRLSPEEHSRRARKRWENPEYRAGGRARLEQSRQRTAATHWGRHSAVTFEMVADAAQVIAAEGSLTWQAVATKLGCSQDVIYDRVRAAGFSGWKDFKWTLVQRDEKWAKKTAAPANHKVVSVEYAGAEAVYDIEVEEHHNFALTAGVIVHNTFFQGRTIDVKIPKDTAVYYANEEAERPFYGVSMFESAFYHYDKKTKLYYIVHLAAQRAACGLRIGTMPPNPPAADKNTFVRGLANLGLAQYMVCPSADWTVTNIKEEGNFDFLGLINHHNSQMSKSLLAEWFDEQQGGGQGDTELVDFGKQSDASYMMMLEAILEEMGYIISNHILPRFVDWNFGSSKYPRWVWGTLTSEQKSAIQDTFDKLAAAPQANVSPEFMVQLEKKMAVSLGLVVDYGPIEKREEENTELQDQAKKQQLTMQAHPELGMQGQPGQPPVQAGTTGQQGGGGATGATGPPLGQLPGGAVQPLPSNGNPFGGSGGGSSGNSSSPPGGGPGTPYGRLSVTAADLLHDLIELSRMEAAYEHGTASASPGSGGPDGAESPGGEAGDSDPGDPDH